MPFNQSVWTFSGKRSCVGEPLARQEIFLFLAGLVQNFDVHPPEGLQKIVCEDKFQATLGPTAYKVRLIPRRA